MHSPLKDPKTRYPGQSLSEQIEGIAGETHDALLSPFLFWLVAIIAWVYHFTPGKPNPWAFTVFALAATWVAVRRMRALLKKRANLRKGLLGEQILGKFLEEQLMPHNYQVIHDLVCKAGDRTFNIDHVVVCVFRGNQTSVPVETSPAFRFKTYHSERSDARVL
jgi:hypothetical protein